jgi:hypothetical protein
MEWNANKWTKRTKLIALFILAIICLYYYVGKAHAEETVAEHVKEGVFEDFRLAVFEFFTAILCLSVDSILSQDFRSRVRDKFRSLRT